VKTLSVLGALGVLFVIMGIAVFALLGRGIVFCVQRVGVLGEQLPRKPISQRQIPSQQPWDA
jgi:hypothetical protein